ncbi:unnamed protein product [Acanthoscelides obtectus]|uniref:Glycoside hydrolase family 28 protein n=1 Tax=Acanthoscelides obtectus TaxID=200917 RepID=A0A9P0KU43_ACAOB|nr:unnamed protein product [Acanthoscelides obtectus]CAK1674743.1 Probable polygalacturonase [Acanthoscelides obtectus]
MNARSLTIVQIIIVGSVSAVVYDVTKYGADTTGRNPSTQAIAAAINAAALKNGGIVYFPRGKYTTGPIELKSGIHVDFADGTLITFLDDPKLYPSITVKLPDGKTRHLPYTPLIRGMGVNNVAIKGNAIIDGRGQIWWDRLHPPSDRPVSVHFWVANNIVLQSFHIQNSPMFNVHIVDSNNIEINSISIKNPPDYHGKGPNTDGINLNSVKNVHIANVNIATGDDCIALNGNTDSRGKKPTQNVLIENSHMNAGHGGVSIGSVTSGGLRNITVRNCYFNNTVRGLFIKTNRQRGGTIADIHYHDIVMTNVKKEGIAISAMYNDKDASKKPITVTTPFINNIEYNNIRGNCGRNTISLVGLPESPVQNIRINGFTVTSNQGVLLNNTRDIIINGKRQ